MLKKKKWIILLVVLIAVGAIAGAFLLKTNHLRANTNPQNKPAVAIQKLQNNSPEAVTQTYYLSYEECLKQHTGDLKNIKIQKDCPIHEFTGMAKTFVQENQVTYEDQILCDVEMPLKMSVDKAYIGKDHIATVNVTINTKYDQFVIPVRLQKENGSWKIFRVDCDLDGYLE